MWWVIRLVLTEHRTAYLPAPPAVSLAANFLLMALFVTADRTLVVTMFETLTDINSSVPHSPATETQGTDVRGFLFPFRSVNLAVFSQSLVSCTALWSSPCQDDVHVLQCRRRSCWCGSLRWRFYTTCWWIWAVPPGPQFEQEGKAAQLGSMAPTTCLY